MTVPDAGSSPGGLPITHKLTVVYALSLVIALLMTVVSAAGLLYQTAVYPTEELRSWLVANDIYNLVVGLPLILVPMWLARRGKLIGLLCWPGALLCVLYVYVAYVIGVPFGVLFLPHLLLATLSAYTLIGLMVSIDGQAVRQRLMGIVPARTAGGILLGLAILTLLRQTALIATTVGSQALASPQELAQWIDDFAVGCPPLILVGLELCRRKALGYVGGAGLLLAYGVLSLSLIPILVSASPIDVGGIIVVVIMAALCFAPFAFFVRGSIRS
jgi:hypothetical protein